MLKNPRWRIAICLSMMIFCIGILRMFLVVLHAPLLGYANNFDMVRLQACQQIWPSDPDIQPGTRTYERPLDEYRFDKNLNLGACYPSSELLFTYAGQGLIRLLQPYIIKESFSIKLFGVVRGLSIVVVVWCFLCYSISRKYLFLMIFHVLFFSIVIADPANTLYLNTFYTEFSALFFLYLAVSMHYLACNDKTDSYIIGLIFAGALCGMGFSKPQHIALPLMILICFVIGNYMNLVKKRATIFFALIGVLSSLIFQIYFRQTTTMFSINYANATDTYLWTVLPAATDTDRAAEILGLPADCVEHKGKNWYTPGVQEHHPCPDVLKISRVRILWLIIKDPQFFITVTRHALTQLRPWFLQDIGSIESRNLGIANQIFFTFSDWINKIPLCLFQIVFLIPIMITIIGVGIIVIYKMKYHYNVMTLILLCLSTYAVFYSSLFGDGYADFAKHNHLYFSIFGALIIIVFLIGVKKLDQFWFRYIIFR